VGYKSKSLQLVSDIKEMLENLGYISKIRNSNNSFRLELLGGFNERYIKEIGFISKHFKEHKIKKELTDKVIRLENENFYSVTLVSKEYYGIEEAYDLEISNHPYYLANSFLVHNSDRKKVSSVNEKLELGEPKIDLKIAGAHTEWFNSEFPDIQNYIKVQNDHIAKYGWVDNKFGRRRRLPDVFTKDKYLIAEAQRQGINAQIQGTASDIVQLSIIRITKWLEENQMQSKIIYSVHDELDGYGHPEELEILKEVIPKMMCEKVFPINKIKVELESEFDVYNHRWGD
jgi:hypothetical protein